ncbi:hypothetical protein WB334_25780, partial [Escherichia coli]|uniref:hypothetical protein n=1 Tax=Escherichia coli TaxID=562 RepID=UPI002157C902
MCGIVGIVGDLSHKEKELLRDMMITCSLRGEDSAGFFTVKNHDREAAVTKCIGSPFDLFETKAWDRLSLYDKRIFVGHTRKAT